MCPGGSRMICMIYGTTCFLGWICTTQILRNLSQRQDERLEDLDDDLSDLSVRAVNKRRLHASIGRCFCFSGKGCSTLHRFFLPLVVMLFVFLGWMDLEVEHFNDDWWSLYVFSELQRNGHRILPCVTPLVRTPPKGETLWGRGRAAMQRVARTMRAQAPCLKKPNPNPILREHPILK